MRKPLSRQRRTLIGAAVVAALALVALTPPTLAEAATTGAGYSSGGNGWLGNYITPDGRRGYCIDVQLDWPSGRTDGPYLDDHFDGARGTRGVYGDDIQRLNTGLRAYGETGDATQAAAMNAIVYAYSSANHNGYGGGVHYISSKAPREYGAVKAKYDEIWGYIDAHWADTGGGGYGSMYFDVDADNNYEGSLDVYLWPGNSGGAITLTNGIFLATGSPYIAGVTNGARLGVRGVPPADNVAAYKIRADGSFTGAVTGGSARNIRMYYTGGQQRLIAGGGEGAQTTNFNVTATDPINRLTVFNPVVSTAVAARLVSRGDTFVNILTFSTVADGSGLHNPWAVGRSGNHAVVTARGVLYGPLEEQPAEAAAVPPGAPIAATATVSTDPTRGPNGPYPVTTSESAVSGGFYTWVWTIDSADQRPVTQTLIPASYLFTDRFGRDVETHVVATALEFSTALSSPRQTIGETVDDTITPELLSGFWLRDAGASIPVTLSGTAYYSETLPVQASSAPVTATALGAMTATLTDEGSIVETMPPLPYKRGWVTYQWCLDPAQQPPALQGLVLAYCDDYGVPSETVELEGPVLATAAQPLATPTGTATDALTVTGPVPAVGLDVTYRGYLQPAAASAASSGPVPLTPPTSSSSAGPATPAVQPVCDPTTLVWESTTPQHITEAGTYSSEEFPVTAAHVGTVYWVETAVIGGTDDVWHEGECGLENEKTTVAYPTMTTRAIAQTVLGRPIHDTATITGAVSQGSTLTFDLFRQVADGACRSQDLVVTVGTRSPVTSGGIHPSAEHTPTEAGTYLWVATLRAADGTTLAQGHCGDMDEVSVVTAVPVTGMDPRATAGAAVLLTLAGAAVLLFRRRQRRRGVRPGRRP